VDSEAKAIFLSESPRHSSGCVRRLQSIVQHIYFDIVVFCAILSNTALIGVEVHFDLPGQTVPPVIDILSNCFAIMFTLELVLRIIASGLVNFWWSSRAYLWNWFDTVVVIASAVEITFDYILAANMSMSTFRIMRILKITRLLRILRVPRLIRYVSSLRTLVYSIALTLRSLFSAALLLLIIMYSFGIVFTRAVAESSSDSDKAREFRGSLSTSIFTLFKAICNGVSWHEVSPSLGEVHPFFEALFALYIIVTYFAVLNDQVCLHP